jgi:ribose-phosphate pyrophosphokinase
MKENIYLRFGNVTEEVSYINFPGGEVVPQIQTGNLYPEKVMEVEIVARLTTQGDLLNLIMIHDAVSRVYPRAAISAFIPYMPYARQDRVCNPGEPLSIAVVARLINACNFVNVKILDPHSEVTPALFNRLEVVNQYDIFKDIYSSWREVYIAAPDGGAAKKAEMFAKRVGAAGVIHCTKVRDLETGIISGTRVNDTVEGRTLLVLDDIGDGCGTFVPLLHSLKSQGATSVSLAVTHGLFSKGIPVVSDIYDQVFTTNSYIRHLKGTGNLEVLNVTRETN